MGLTLAMSAFRTDSSETVVAALRKHSAVLANKTAKTAAVFPVTGGWSAVSWSVDITEVAKATRNLSHEIGVLASAIFVYDDDYWMHALVHDGEVLDRFCTEPEELAEEAADLASWSGQPDVIAPACGVDARYVRPYLGPSRDREGKAFDDDEFELWNCWVFVDFWRRIGITYPPDIAKPLDSVSLAPGWTRGLSLGDPWF